MPEMKTDCFAYNEKGCAALSETLCTKRENCPFYATKAQAAESREKAMSRAVMAGYYMNNGKYEPKEGRA